MSHRVRRLAVSGLAAALCLTGASAALGQADSTADRMNQLESMVKAQQEQIASLQQTLAAQGAAGVEQMRVEEIKRVVQELFRDPEFRDQLPLNAGYKDGFFIRSGDDFLLKINGRMQARYTFYGKDGGNRDPGSALFGTHTGDRSNLAFNRIRLAFSGHMWDPAFTYRLELKADRTDDVSLQYAWVNYQFRDEMGLRIGVFKLPFGRQETTSSAGLQFVDRSLANELFNAGRSMTAMLHGSVLDKRLDYGVALSNGIDTNFAAGDEVDVFRSLDTNPAVTARAVYHVLYDKLGADFKGIPDLEYHKKPALDVGTSFAYSANKGDNRNFLLPYAIPDLLRGGPGGYGLANTLDTQIAQWGADMAFKYLGFSLTAEYFLRMIDVKNNTAPLALLSRRDATRHQQGGYVQAGYFIVPEKLEAVARVGGVWDIEGDNVWEFAGGMNYYIRGHNLKIQADVTSISELPVRSGAANFYNINDDIVMFRMQLQAAF